ncbi:MAG: transcriptional regulator NrdR [Candidatus Omnitrophica bacterium]|nr:transcriptional repressor NrdR [bacterium]MBK7496631.1 transcriptional repressor NrdR [Candidatus Omnitrophota bacterium]MCE7909840.1 transcriptional repressor NrdR [Candidatus Omnitrophica bacterium COP1]MBW7940210.1 transcriptional repressor NrdR [Candidatus Omnitrophota bacterium]MCC6734146.1 transcriptional repressor NrdR [Candidatus Omnitrophota bacterium]
MRCPYCAADNDHVVDSRTMSGGASIRRRRECLECHRRFTTFEHVDDIPLMIIKKDGRREPYHRDKVVAGIRIACQKRPISEDQIQDLTSQVEQSIFSQMEKEVESSVVGEMVMEHLRELDQVAYVRFASVYRSFKDVTEFLAELSSLMDQSRDKSKHKNPSRKKIIKWMAK